MTKVIMVRHGQTTWNLEHKYQGHSDIVLSEQGIRQAELAAKRLADEPIQAVYASDLSRAFKTAEIIAAKHRLPVSGLAELREINFGKWEGLTYEQIYAGWPELIKTLYNNPDESQVPGGETFRTLKERAFHCLETLLARHPDETILLVSHGGTIRTLLCAVLNIHLNHIWKIKQDNTAVNIIEFNEAYPVVALLNDTHHLKE
ncbi:hypothetical protein P22_0082 [Propionispora sp. 2/2-37]|uniref:alpha-ribazole phosphatase n=1 Tax=Propionispora sp. 2/2-37 TaxID=1677858 RepID=UPI0006BB7C0F|nr:alpha-ribazole phosphatase [Propionispora sp. 2/2-37]CUH94020.1 hypothetical protein P22_0082 [Propionispora sp. 2/2-37]